MKDSMKDRIDGFLKESINQKVFTGASYAVRRGDVLVINSLGALGETDVAVDNRTLFDIASCTKLYVALSFLRLMEDGKIALTDTVERYLPSWRNCPAGKITMFELLTHTGRLPSHVPLYQMSRNREEALEVLKELPLRNSSGVEYSCLGFIILGVVIEAVTGTSLDEIVNQYIIRPLGMESTLYRPDYHRNSNIMPTEYCTWRNRLLIGEVHDENAFHMGGISGNAGIFSNIYDMCRLADALLCEDTHGPRLLHKRTVSVMSRNYTKKYQENRGLGWCVKNDPDMTAGEYFSEKSFGHTGFTGTSIWLEPNENSYAILLTNRVFYTRDITEIRHVRQVFHTLCWMDEPVN